MNNNVLMGFQSLSRISPNPNKSDICPSSIPFGIREQIVQILGFRQGELPVKYFEGPSYLLKTFRLFIVKPLLIESLLKFSTGNVYCFHMLAKRVQLINSVLLSIQV